MSTHEHPDAARVAFIRDDAPTAELVECEDCGELIPADEPTGVCEICKAEGWYRYRREHDSGAER